MYNTMTNPSSTFVNDTCLASCKIMKLQSRQLMCLSSSYLKIPFKESGKEILESLTNITKSLNDIQDSLNKTGKFMRMELDDIELESTDINDLNSDAVLLTKKEYLLLNAVFQEYSNIITSNEFSIFSKSHDIHRELGLNLKCQEKEEK